MDFEEIVDRANEAATLAIKIASAVEYLTQYDDEDDLTRLSCPVLRRFTIELLEAATDIKKALEEKAKA